MFRNICGWQLTVRSRLGPAPLRMGLTTMIYVQSLHCGTRSLTEPSMLASSHHIPASQGLRLQPPADPAPSDGGQLPVLPSLPFPSATPPPMSWAPISGAGSTGFP